MKDLVRTFAGGLAGAAVLVTLALLAPPSSEPPAPAPTRLTGLMGDFTVYTSPLPVPEIAFTDGAGTPRTLSDFRGRVVLLNFWATWCGPCVREMPDLDRLQAALGAEGLSVVALSLDRQGMAKVGAFYDRHALANLAVYLDKTGRARRDFAVSRLPTSFLIGRDGQVIGRLDGPAVWDGEQARGFLRHYLAPPS